MKFKLQINNSGAWKTVLEFGQMKQAQARECVENMSLLDLSGWNKTTWRIVGADGAAVAYWCTDLGWKDHHRG
jgi:hypothetical protein